MTHPGEVIVDEDFRCSSQFGPLGDAGILGRLPERWREIIPPSISLSRAVLMISQKIGRRLTAKRVNSFASGDLFSCLQL